MSRKKISLIGGGNIGGSLAYLALLKNLGDVVILDINKNMAKGKALDLSQGIHICTNHISIIGTDNYEDIKDSDVIIITAGVPRKSGMSRDDLIEINTKVIKNIGENIKKYSPNAFVICITNPLDVMTWVLQQSSKLPTNKVVGMAGVLDSARFAFFLSQELNISISDIQTLVLGCHGDSMVPILNYTTVSGITINEMIKMGKITKEKLDNIIARTRKGGSEIVELLGNGSSFYTPALSAIAMAESYIFNQKRCLSCSSFVRGKYNINDIYIGVPSIIGSEGVEEVIEIKLTEEEQAGLKISIKDIESLMEIAKNHL